ncbi:MAG: hypothetical protein LBL47_04085 [Lactobacillus sp.]|jgi:TPR repeat protein|nr:hypothetical protein [Lactobacillus sp.]
MKKILYIISFALLFPHLCYAASLDEIYRDIVKSDNDGYLPLFVKNRKAPDFLEDQTFENSNVKASTEKSDPIDLTDQRKLRNEAFRAEEKKWKETVEAIKLNQITPVELAEVEKRVNQNNPKAIEILAWMLARGVGIQQDLPRAFTLYQRAAFLNVADAERNAIIVYRAMNAEERSMLQPFQIPEDMDDETGA